jgi:hypothetical protein
MTAVPLAENRSMMRRSTDSGVRPETLSSEYETGPSRDCLNLRHTLVHLDEPPVAAADSDGKRQEHQTEFGAQLARNGLIERPKVERHHRLDFGDGAAVILQVVTQGAADRREQDIVDRGLVRVRDAFDTRERQWLRPGDAPADPGIALEGGRGIGGVSSRSTAVVPSRTTAPASRLA